MSLRGRLFASYALVILVCLLLVGLSAAALLNNYRDRIIMDKLNAIAKPVSLEIKSLVTSQATVATLWADLQEQAQANNVYMLLLGPDGKILRWITPRLALPQPVPKATLPASVSQATQGTFVATDGRTFIYATYPLGKLPSTATTAAVSSATALLLATPRSGAGLIAIGLFWPLFFAGIIALGISLIVALLIARSVYKPLGRVTAATADVARGQYDQQVPESGPAEVRQLAASFNNMAAQVKQSQQQLRHFVADVSHELKSPLTSIQGFAQALVDGTASDEPTRRKAAGIINDEARRMRRQVDELLELARVQSGQLKMAREPVNVRELIERCREVFSLQAADKKVVLVSETRRGAMTVKGDADRLEEVLDNLLDNAIKNSPKDGQVTVFGQPLEGGWVEIKVSDQGPGISPEQLPHVFERFYQVTGVRTGVGLGLTIAREIVMAHRGTIEVRSEPGEGAEFTIRLPAADAPAQ